MGGKTEASEITGGGGGGDLRGHGGFSGSQGGHEGQGAQQQIEVQDTPLENQIDAAENIESSNVYQAEGSDSPSQEEGKEGERAEETNQQEGKSADGKNYSGKGNGKEASESGEQSESEEPEGDCEPVGIDESPSPFEEFCWLDEDQEADPHAMEADSLGEMPAGDCEPVGIGESPSPFEPFCWLDEGQEAGPQATAANCLEEAAELPAGDCAPVGIGESPSPFEPFCWLDESQEAAPQATEIECLGDEAERPEPGDAASEGQPVSVPVSSAPVTPQITRDQIPAEVERLRDSYHIPSPRGWSEPGRRIDLTHNPHGEGNRVRMDDLLAELENPRTARMIGEQLDRIEERFTRLGRSFDRSLLLHVAYRESGNTLTRSRPGRRVHTLGRGGMDYLGANAPRLEREGLIARGVIEPAAGVNERGRVVPSARVPARHLAEAYAARIAMAQDSFRDRAGEHGFDVDDLEPAVERAWTMIFFGQETAGRAILQHLQREGGDLESIMTDDSFVNDMIVRESVRVRTAAGPRDLAINPGTVRILIRRGRVAAADAELVDGLSDEIDARLPQEE